MMKHAVHPYSGDACPVTVMIEQWIILVVGFSDADLKLQFAEIFSSLDFVLSRGLL